ncbi:MAG: MgtC/SapB family protein [Treponema sp.]|nr:MgtC/SapB family protein [Treponema sp.]MDE7382559.1 MgtC/SapB family protein [Treponemataceae bacterium]
MIDFNNVYIDYAVRMAAAVVCGLFLGIERKSRRQAVGMRTLVLISVSSAMLTIISVALAEFPNLHSPHSISGDPTRIASGIITGIGFMGAGEILHSGLNIRGLTSAAVIWTSSALGIACGAGYFYIAGITLFVTFLSLLLLKKVEMRLFPAEKSRTLKIVCEGMDVDFEKIQREIDSSGLVQRDVNIKKSLESDRVELKFSVNTPNHFNIFQFTEKMMQVEKILEVSIE